MRSYADYNSILPVAEERARQMIAAGLYNRFGATDEDRLMHARLGCIGELAFKDILDMRHIPYFLDTNIDEEHHTDNFDFKIGEKKIDVKVAKTTRQPMPEWTFGYPQQQTYREKDYIIIGWINPNNGFMAFYGWMPFENILNYPVVEINSFANYRYYTPNHEFPWGDLNTDFNELFRETGVIQD